MSNEKDAVASFLNGVSEPKEIFNEGKTEEPVVEVEEQEDKPLPFHKDPKVQRYVEKEISKALKGIQPSAEREFKKETDEITLPSSFVKLIGNDTPEKLEVLKDMSKYFGGLKGEAKQEFLEELKQQEQARQQADVAALEELTSGFEQIEEEYGVDLDSDKKTRAAFVEFLRKASPKNQDGEVERFADIPSTWEIFQEVNKKAPQPNRAKEIAARGLTRSSDTETKAFRPTSWSDVDKNLAKLTSNP